MLILGIILIAANMRPAITSVGPVVRSIREDLHLSNGVAGFITTLPLISFALISPLAPKIAQKLSNELTLLLSLLILIFGICLRYIPTPATLFIGTALIGIGIAIANVLLPSLIKHKFPAKVGIMTSLYSTFMGCFAALASGITVPLAQGLHLGWRKALFVWGILVIIAIVIWLPQLQSRETFRRKVTTGGNNRSVWSSGIAWQVTFFMGLQSFLFYSTIAWLPEILNSHGLSMASAGWMLSIMQFISLPAAFITPIVADKMNNQITIVVGIDIFYMAGLLGLQWGGNTILLTIWIFLIGLAQGASISLALAMIGLRSENAKQAGDLSGMAQSAGYLLAAIGPIFIGFLFDQTNTWSLPIYMLIFVSIIMLIAGIGAGRNQYLFKK
ncbi:transporter [Heyndrickxia ginsengihumi]|uniref:Transporter n=1 Tax=Heyndrickxia ginsengihumi TaxID=363870 RepID=A0A0A6V9X3_9BACI|nr:MFS transporter [Heyndrickxia ginsengihumi]KHD84313.1 transporter [Heyndrickxia ginsengihumi]